ncbi:glycoside hydrolase family 16 protein [Saccharothrix longispora]|uniref:GH16 domain-containing protein n=1 Tax=Saccharothrix longispora TaxID=33920 RepID=A0ABU1PSK8_9PSEU|nr:glycoside hydrolase family 16 protein [Saccharothrix longispora]MDR6593451.1 hypothetical protein [Saccharothrix longispora]
MFIAPKWLRRLNRRVARVNRQVARTWSGSVRRPAVVAVAVVTALAAGIGWAVVAGLGGDQAASAPAGVSARSEAPLPRAATSTPVPPASSSSAEPVPAPPPAPVVAPAGDPRSGGSPAPSGGEACGRFFDDFRYASSGDGRFTAAGWTARSESGGPGPRGARWSPGDITFPSVEGEQVAQLSASTDGTNAGTSQAELVQQERRFGHGTYASRVRFTDAPITGADGDHVMQAYLTITPLRGDDDPLYSQLSFTEYTPNGAWGGRDPLRSHASVHTIRSEPYEADQAVTSTPGGFGGWHTVVTQVGGGHVRYHVDGVLVADHVDDGKGRSVLPRQPMSLNYNLWFIDLEGHRGGVSTYVQQVDWTYYAQDELVAPADVQGQVAAHRAASSARVDTLRGGERTPPRCRS